MLILKYINYIIKQKFGYTAIADTMKFNFWLSEVSNSTSFSLVKDISKPKNPFTLKITVGNLDREGFASIYQEITILEKSGAKSKNLLTSSFPWEKTIYSDPLTNKEMCTFKFYFSQEDIEKFNCPIKTESLGVEDFEIHTCKGAVDYYSKGNL